jgi:hypothetical protein
MGRVIGGGGANLKDLEERLDVRVEACDDEGEACRQRGWHVKQSALCLLQSAH